MPSDGDLPIIILGDTNIDILLKDNSSTQYNSFISGNGLEHKIEEVARPNFKINALTAGSFIDHITIANCGGLIKVSAEVLTKVFSDHYPV